MSLRKCYRAAKFNFEFMLMKVAAMLEINPILEQVTDLKERENALRGYL